MRTWAERASMARVASVVMILLGCGGAPGRDQARTAADLTRDRPPPLSFDLSEPEREGLRTDVAALNERIDAVIHSTGRTDAMDLLRLAVALEVSEPACGPECEHRLFLLYDGLAVIGATGFTFFAADPSEESAVYDRMLARAPMLSRWAIGRVLSTTDDPERVAFALVRLSGRERADGHLDRARDYLEWAIAVAPSAERHAERGELCYRLGDLSCGDEELRGATGEEARADLERLSRAAHLLDAPASTVEEELAHAEALVTLGRPEEAVSRYERIAERHPDDARPHVGLARLAYFSTAHLLDPITEWRRVAAHLDRAAALDHRDARYYEIATLVWASRVMASAMGAGPVERPELLGERLDQIVTGLRELDPATAGAIDLYGRILSSSVGAPSVPMPPISEALALRARHPENRHVIRVGAFLAVMGSERPDLDALGSLPGEEEVLRRARTAAAMSWDDPAMLGEGTADGELGAIELTLRAQHGLASWSDVAERYRALAEEADGPSVERLADGAAAAMWRSGDREGARALFARLTGPAAELNQLATMEASARDAAWEERLEALTAIDDPGIACCAARWLVEAGASDDLSACGGGEGRSPRDGTLSSGSDIQFEFTLSSRDGFSSILEVRLEPWLLVVP